MISYAACVASPLLWDSKPVLWLLAPPSRWVDGTGGWAGREGLPHGFAHLEAQEHGWVLALLLRRKQHVCGGQSGIRRVNM